jgi:hypothetical protein
MVDWSNALGQIRGGIGKCLLIVSLASLGACASFDGQPRAVLTPSLTAITADYAPQVALAAYGRLATPEERRVYRNTVIGIYMVAADANYLEFRRGLSQESKGSNFALGSGFTAFSTAATVATEHAANILSAFASGLSGIQGQLSAEVYFRQTLPALLAGMEASRIRVRTNIVARLDKQDEYSLTQAFLDLASYEAAGSLDSAIETITNEASEHRQQEQARFENIIGVGGIVATPAARASLRTLTARIDALALNSARAEDVAKISQHLHLRTQGVSVQDQATAIDMKLRTMLETDSGSLDRFVEEMKALGVDLTQ